VWVVRVAGSQARISWRARRRSANRPIKAETAAAAQRGIPTSNLGEPLPLTSSTIPIMLALANSRVTARSGTSYRNTDLTILASEGLPDF
jgi:hypothetical protein